MAAGIWNFTIEQGTTYVQPLIWSDDNKKPIDLTGYSAHMQIRDASPSPGTDTVLYKDLSTAGGQIALGGSNGTISLQLTAAETAALTFKTAVYDLSLISPSGAVIRLLEGTVSVSAEVTVN